ncbi:PREDICTED: uncharacterized protein LOC104820912 [Tarenaya hassleriana]|uniref:uncharacterized protein LOC104820912 n=1 Tax=Tarenaya hassleriana TaxID=28532 RepID=UPI00053C115A|nr:PREDICTED: uncharacterized protein LOC104820912 [Tarenaya hassleriana]
MVQEEHGSATSTGGDAGEVVNGNKTDLLSEQKSLYSVLCRTIGSILFSDPKSPTPLLQRIRNSLADNGEDLREASRKTAHEILLWTRRGSPLRALLVVSIGTILLLTATGLLVFMLFFLAATANAIIISLLVSLAAAGGFLAIFFVCVTAIYIGALSIAAFVISVATISAVVSVLIASGWIGFFWAMWLTATGGMRMAKQSLSVMGSAISANSLTRHRHEREVKVALN